MHEYRRFVQEHLDANGWRAADLVRKSGLSKQVVSYILRDDREHLGQMPDPATIEKLARGFGVPPETVRTAAARSLVDYSDDGTALTITLSEVSTDALLNEIRRRIDAAPHQRTSHPAHPAPAAGTQGAEDQKNAGKPDDLTPTESTPAPGRGDYDLVARTRRRGLGPADPDAYDGVDLPPDDDGPEEGA